MTVLTYKHHFQHDFITHSWQRRRHMTLKAVWPCRQHMTLQAAWPESHQSQSYSSPIYFAPAFEPLIINYFMLIVFV